MDDPSFDDGLSEGRRCPARHLGWASALSFFSEGPVSPFLLFFLFVLLAAAYRWGFRETLATAAATVLIFLLETTVVAVGPWSRTWFARTPIILRITYLLRTCR